MPNRILILCDEPDLDSLIRDTLESWGQERTVRLDIMTVTCIEDAWHAVKSLSGPPFDLVITRLDMPRVKNESVTPGQRLGVEFLHNAKQLGGFASCIMADNGDTALFNALLKIHNAHVVSTRGGDIGANMRLALDTLFEHEMRLNVKTGNVTRRVPRATYETRIADIVVTFSNENARYQITCYEGRQRKWSHTTIIKTRLPWNDLLYLTQELRRDRNNHFLKRLKNLGKTFNDALFSDKQFYDDFREAIGFAEGRLSQICIRFVTGKHEYPVLLEAICDDKWGWWMFEAPITRSLTVSTWAEPLFWDENSITRQLNILIVEGEADGYLKQGQLEGQFLAQSKYIHDECNAIGELVTNASGVDNVIRVPDPKSGLGGADSFATRIQEVLNGSMGIDVFDIVHCAAHSFVHDGIAYLAVPNSIEASRPDSIRVEQFAEWLKGAGTRLLYLSSCSDATQELISQLARQGVPAIVGYRWAVPDDVANIVATSFYNYICRKNRSLEQAIVYARKQAKWWKNEMPDAWISPVMVLQTADRGDLSSIRQL